MPIHRLRIRILSFVAFALVVGSSCFDLAATYPLGSLGVRVVDENNAGIQGALLDLYKIENGSPIHWRATASSSDGRAVFGERDGGVIEGDYFIRVRFTTSHALAEGESNDRSVTVREGDDIVVTFRAVPQTPDFG
jgi:hypothetical protein